jgi:hypothetical protein
MASTAGAITGRGVGCAGMGIVVSVSIHQFELLQETGAIGLDRLAINPQTCPDIGTRYFMESLPISALRSSKFAPSPQQMWWHLKYHIDITRHGLS